MKIWSLVLILVLVAGVLAGCGGEDAAPVEDVGNDVQGSDAQGTTAQELESSVEDAGYTSEALDASYEGALPASTQLALGVFELQGTENAVTVEQANALLPLWQVIQAGSLESDAETNAVLKQIEGTLTAEQLATIAALQLTFRDMGAWMQEQGVSLGRPGGAAGGPGASGDMTEEERAAMRATRQAGGGGQGGGFGDMSEEDRANMRATAEAGGMTLPGGGPGGGARGGSGQLALLAEQVVELLAEAVGE